MFTLYWGNADEAYFIVLCRQPPDKCSVLSLLSKLMEPPHVRKGAKNKPKEKKKKKRELDLVPCCLSQRKY